MGVPSFDTILCVMSSALHLQYLKTQLMQCPNWHESPAAHALPQSPQLPLSKSRSTQAKGPKQNVFEGSWHV
jgi:hypothetical protein